MFGNISVEHAVREPAAPKVTDVPSEILHVIRAAWNHQLGNPKEGGHIVRLESKELVDKFHAFGHAAVAQMDDLKLKYRRLSRVGSDKNENTAYFSLAEKGSDEEKPAADVVPLKAKAKK